MTLIKIPTGEFFSQNSHQICVLTATRQEVEHREVTIWERRRRIWLLSSTPLATLALLECVATLRGDVLNCYVLSVPIGLTQMLELFLRRLCSNALRVSVPLSYEVYRHLRQRRWAMICLKLTVVGGCALLVVVNVGSPSPLLGRGVVLVALTLWAVEHWLLAHSIHIHRHHPDAVTIAIPDSVTRDTTILPRASQLPAFMSAPTTPLFRGAWHVPTAAVKPS
jgi:hypothetical protein